MELRQIHYFIEVVDQGSFTQAAEACFISQSAISQQVKALEEELGLPCCCAKAGASPSPRRETIFTGKRKYGWRSWNRSPRTPNVGPAGGNGSCG